jgi:hypothetical protein
MAAEGSESGSFTGGDEAAEARVGTYSAGRVPNNDGWSVALEPVVQSSTNMLQISALKTYIKERNLGQAHMPQRGARVLWPQK